MLKADLIYNITNLPSATRLFDSIRKIELPNLMTDTEFRDSVLKQYQFRKCNFEIVKYEDLPETIKKQVFSIFCNIARDDSKPAHEFVCNYANKLWDLTYKFLKVYYIEEASKSTLNSKTKAELEEFYNDYMELFNNSEKEIEEKLPELLEAEVRRIIPNFSKCVIYFEQRYIFQGQIREFYDHDLSNYALDKISDRTPEDCSKLIEKRNATDNAIYEYYQKNPGIRD